MNLFPGREIDLQRIPAQLRYHNTRRIEHQSPSLVISVQLTKIAMKHAEQLQKMGKLVHSQAKYKGKDLGQNIAHREDKGIFSEIWYKEAQKYDFLAENIDECGHFTQMIWKEAREVGFGVAGDFCVANYFPAGNYQDQVYLNVLRKKLTK